MLIEIGRGSFHVLSWKDRWQPHATAMQLQNNLTDSERDGTDGDGHIARHTTGARCLRRAATLSLPNHASMKCSFVWKNAGMWHMLAGEAVSHQRRQLRRGVASHDATQQDGRVP